MVIYAATTGHTDKYPVERLADYVGQPKVREYVSAALFHEHLVLPVERLGDYAHAALRVPAIETLYDNGAASGGENDARLQQAVARPRT